MCWPKLQTFHEFYHKVKVTHHNRFKSKDETLEVNATPNSDHEIAAIGRNRVNPKTNLLRQNKAKKHLKSINRTTLHAKNSVTIKKRTLKLNSNSGQSREISLQIEEDGKNVRCNILKAAGAVNEMDQTDIPAKKVTITNRAHTQTTGTNRNEETESESESESERIDIANHPARQIKMEEELIIMDEDYSADDSTNEFNANIYTRAEEKEEDQQQLDALQQPKRPYWPSKFAKCNICGKELLKTSISNHQVTQHNMCSKCKQTFSSFNKMSAHKKLCVYSCNLCDKRFEVKNAYTMHMKAHQRESKELIRKREKEKILKKWALQLITEN